MVKKPGHPLGFDNLSTGVAGVDRIEELPRLVRRQHRRLAFLRRVLRTPHARRRIVRDDLADHQIIEEHSERRQMLLDRPRMAVLFEFLIDESVKPRTIPRP
jgi:hypothetical protein